MSGGGMKWARVLVGEGSGVLWGVRTPPLLDLVGSGLGRR